MLQVVPTTDQLLSPCVDITSRDFQGGEARRREVQRRRGSFERDTCTLHCRTGTENDGTACIEHCVRRQADSTAVSADGGGELVTVW